MKTYIIDNGSKYIAELVRILDRLKPVLINYDSIDHSSIRDDDMIVLSGGHGYPVLWHDAEYRKEIDIIKNHTGPIIGICLGFELVSHVYGSHLHQLIQRRKGMVTIIPASKNSIVTDMHELQVYENHNWSVQKLKLPLIALARSSDGIEVMKHISKPIYGMQFHPEGKEGSGSLILENILLDILPIQYKLL
jgi:GMP synthase (glutamine-hydrolysing)